MSMPNMLLRNEELKQIIEDIKTKNIEIQNVYKNYGFSEVTEKGFSRFNVSRDLSNDATLGVKEEETMPTVGTVNDYQAINAIPLTGYTKNGVVYANPTDPSTVLNETHSNTVATDRADGNLNIDRWITRNIFKFTQDQYGFDKCFFKIPTKDLANGVVIDQFNGAPHENTLAYYPYPEEIIMTSQNSEKNFIHFINAQYKDGHYGHFNGKNYNLIIVKNRTKYGVLTTDNAQFTESISVFTNDVTTDLAFVNNEYLYLPVPDEMYGEELLGTMWDCRVIWRHDPPDRNIIFSAEIQSIPIVTEYKDLDICNGRLILYGNDKSMKIETNRDSFNIDNFSTISNYNHNMHGSHMFGNNELAIAPSYTSGYDCHDTVGGEIAWNEVYSPNQIFRISKDYYIGFSYYDTTRRGSNSYQNDFVNRRNQLYWGLFDNKMNCAHKLTSGSTEIYPCTDCINDFATVNTSKILKIYKDKSDPISGVTTFMVFSQTGWYKFTFTLNGDEISATFETKMTSLNINNVIKKSADKYYLFTNNTNMQHLDNYLEDKCKIFNYTFTIEDIGITACKNVCGKYGIYETNDGNILCKLVEHYSFDTGFFDPPIV